MESYPFGTFHVRPQEIPLRESRTFDDSQRAGGVSAPKHAVKTLLRASRIDPEISLARDNKM